MPRTRPPNRRFSATRKIPVTLEGKDHMVTVTVGFLDGRPIEVFCASFKVGTSLNAIVGDACILLSRLLQHGDGPEELAKTLCTPPSLIGRVAQAVAEECGHVVPIKED